jgi:hypothetical protein
MLKNEIITLVKTPCACVLVMQREMIFADLLLLKGKVHFNYSCGLLTYDTVEESISCCRISQNDTNSSTCSS